MMKERVRENSTEKNKNSEQALCEALVAPLRAEIVESEKARVDFLKYKLLAVAALGSIGLGLNIGDDGALLDHVYILSMVPFLCLYIDLLCHHNTLRILVIGQYLASRDCPYENFLAQVDEALPKLNPSKKNIDVGFFFELEDWPLDCSTIFLSLLVCLAGVCLPHQHGLTVDNYSLIFSGMIGTVLAVLSKKAFLTKKSILSQVGKEVGREAKAKRRL